MWEDNLQNCSLN